MLTREQERALEDFSFAHGGGSVRVAEGEDGTARFVCGEFSVVVREDGTRVWPDIKKLPYITTENSREDPRIRGHAQRKAGRPVTG